MKTVDLLKPNAGLRIFISGAATGIGAVIAEAFLETGALVYICDIDSAAVDAMKKKHPLIHAGVAHVGKYEDVDAVMLDAQQKLGGLDILINNAGIAGPTGPVEDITPDAWEKTISTNLNSQYYFLRRAVPLLKQTSDNPSIIMVSSVAGRLGYQFRTPYASTKWAIVGLMKSLAIELGPNNIRVNAILPGVVEGPRMDSVIAARAETLGLTFEAMREDYVKKISLRRLVTTQDVAAMALFLSSPAARNISGQAISVDGNLEYL